MPMAVQSCLDYNTSMPKSTQKDRTPLQQYSCKQRAVNWLYAINIVGIIRLKPA
jgi:hypothetical protein